MEGMLSILQGRSLLVQETAKQEIRNCNEVSQRFGLMLDEEAVDELVRCRENALKGAGRVELGSGILTKLIYAFCDSPYLSQENYAATLEELQEAFYYYKSEAEDRYTDDELIEFMLSVFHGRAQGSVEYLEGTSLEELCRYAKGGYDPTDGKEAGDWF